VPACWFTCRSHGRQLVSRKAFLLPVSTLPQSTIKFLYMIVVLRSLSGNNFMVVVDHTHDRGWNFAVVVSSPYDQFKTVKEQEPVKTGSVFINRLLGGIVTEVFLLAGHFFIPYFFTRKSLLVSAI